MSVFKNKTDMILGVVTLQLFIILLMATTIKFGFDFEKSIEIKDKQQIELISKLEDRDKEIAILYDEVKKLNKEIGKIKRIEQDFTIYKKYSYALSDSKKYHMSISDVRYMLKCMDDFDLKISPHVMLALYEAESNYNKSASNSTARGYGQLTRSTGKYRYEKVLKLGKYDHDMAYDPKTNIYITTHYFAEIVKRRKGNLFTSLIRYNGNEIGKKYYQRVNKILIKNTGKYLGLYDNESRQQYE